MTAKTSASTPHPPFELSPQRSLTVRARRCRAARSLKIASTACRHAAGVIRFVPPYAFAAGCASPAMSIRTPAPIVLEMLTLRR